MTNPATRYGPTAEQEFDSAADHDKERLTYWLDDLSGLTDAEFVETAVGAIHGSALANSWRGNWDADHCKATAAYAEAKQRRERAGHTEHCTGDTLYSVAFARVWRSQGHSASAYPPRPCDCGADTPAH